jgi:hypothetical protein
MHYILPLNRSHVIIRSVYLPFSADLILTGASLQKQTVLSIVYLRDVESILNREIETCVWGGGDSVCIVGIYLDPRSMV